jgi:hypothetical protein
MSSQRWLRVIAAVLLLLMVALPVAADTGDMSLFGQDLLIEAGQHATGNAAVVGGNATIQEDSTLSGDLTVLGGNARIDGTVEGAVVVMGGTLDLSATARVLGDVVAMGTLNRHPDAVVRGTVVAGAEQSERAAVLGDVLRGEPGLLLPQSENGQSSGVWTGLLGLLRWIGTLVGSLLLGVLAVLLIPVPVDHIVDVMKRSSGLSIGMGALTLIATAILIPLLTIIIVGIPVVVVLLVALVLGGVVGWAATGLLLGQRLQRSGTQTRVASAALGIVILTLLGKIPCVGWIVTLAAVCWGLGAVVLTRFGTSGQQIWEPFASLAGPGVSKPSAPGADAASRTLAPVVASPVVSPSQPAEAESSEADQEGRKDDTRRLNDLDDDLSQYTRN